MSSPAPSLRTRLRSLWRHRWAFAVPIATLVLPAVVHAVRQADEYRAPALVHVRMLQSEHIGRGLPEELGARPEELLATVRDLLHAKPPVSAAAEVLYPDEPSGGTAALEKTRARLLYEQVGTAAFSVSIAAGDPEAAAAATNELVRAFLESERALRVRRAENNRLFHQRELEAAQDTYRKALAALDAYRLANRSTLPESRDGTREILRRTATEISAQDTLIAAARRRMESLDEQLAAVASTRPAEKKQEAGAATEAMRLQLGQAQRALHDARKELAELRSRYTEEHPDVLRVRTAVSVHEGAVNEALVALERVQTQARSEAEETSKRLRDSRVSGLQDLRALAEKDVAAAEARKVILRASEAELQDLIVAIPGTEAGLGPINRELEEATKILAIRQQDAAATRAASEFYTRGDSSDVTRYRVDAWATAPLHPSGPARWRYPMGALILGSILGYGLMWFRTRLEGHNLESIRDLTTLFPRAVVVALPDPRPRKTPRIRPGDLILTGYVTACLVLSVLAVAIQRGWTEGPGWMQRLLHG